MSDNFARMQKHDHEQVSYFQDEASGLKAIVAIHNTTLGPALGGCRMWPYRSEEEALTDVLRLSRGMTYKASVAGLNLGGGKAVIIGDSKKDKSEALFRAFGRFVEGLGGRYITAEDVGTNVKDMEIVLLETNFVAGLSHRLGGGGDPSPVTARGVYHGIYACAKHKLKKTSISGLKVGIQGLGNVGMHLAQYLHEDGCELFVADIDKTKVEDAVKRFRATALTDEDIYQTPMDVFAPCALGGILNDVTIGKLKCSIVAGAANNQLEKKEHGRVLRERGILYAPDYVINSGGLINVACEFGGYDQGRALQRTGEIYNALLKIFSLAEQNAVSTNEASDIVAEQRLKETLKLSKIHVPHLGKREYFAKLRYHLGA